MRSTLHAHCCCCSFCQAGALLVVGSLPWQKEVLCTELMRHDPDVPMPADISAEVGGEFTQWVGLDEYGGG